MTTPSTTTTTSPSTSTTPTTTTTLSTTTTRDARQGGNERFAVIVNKRGCIRRVLSSYGSLYPASCLVRCPLYDKIMPDGRTCLKVIRNQLQERRSVAKLRCWKGYCRDGVCVTTHFSQQCEVPKNRTFTRRPDLLAE
uniref:Evasin n=2 Tax=Rhipicephalus microplus TaxID=6941 RepID=A0A6G5A4Z5_RHIMP